MILRESLNHSKPRKVLPILLLANMSEPAKICKKSNPLRALVSRKRRKTEERKNTTVAIQKRVV
jgi:hypothetical protein